MRNLTELLNDLESEIQKNLNELIEIHGVESNTSGTKVLKIEDDELMYNLENTSTYVVEISSEHLISESGYLYSHEGIELVQLCEIIDSFNN